MARRQDVSVRPYLSHALMATLFVVGLPFAAIMLWVLLGDPAPTLVPALVVGGLLTLVAFATGVTLWKRRPESADIAFGELMIWGWVKRKRAEDTLHQGAGLLGLDRSGQPTEVPQPVRITPERQLEVLHELNEALESKDPYTHGHSQRVGRHSYRTAVSMGLPASAIEELRIAAALHDVGKIRVPDRILRKPGQLTIEERAIVEEHVVVGAWMVSGVTTADVVSAVRHHHERWDGHGYPDGLAGTDIPLYARMIAVADAYDAITSTRPYRVSSGREHAVEILQRGAGTQFDPMIVTSFVEALPVRLPVAGMLALFAAPLDVWRRIAVWLKRAGAGNLAPTAAMVGAVVTLGSFVPSLPSQGPSRAAPSIAVETQHDDGSEVASEPARDRSERTRTVRDRPSVVAVAAQGPGPGDAAPPDDTIVLSDELERPGDPAPEPKPEPKPESKPEPKPEPEPQRSDEPVQSSGSRNPNDGKDGCPNDGDAGRGNDHECGAREHPSDKDD